MAFSPEELKIIEYGRKNGKSKDEVKAAISKYRDSKPESDVAQPDKPGYIKRVTENVKTDMYSRSVKVGEILDRKDTPAIEKGLQLFGQGAGMAANALETATSEIPGVKKVMERIGAGLNWLATSNWSPIKHLGDVIGQSKSLQELVTLYEDDPNFRDTVDAVANSVRLATDIKGAVDMGVSAVNTTQKAVTVMKDTALATKNAAGDALNTAKNKVIPPRQEFYSSVEEAKQIMNPDNYYTPTERGNAYLKGNVEVKGKGMFERESIKQSTTPQVETLAELVDEGKISAKNLPSQNIKVIEQEARIIDGSIDEFVNRADLNKPFNQNTINKTLNNLEKTAADNLTFVSDTVEQKAYQQVVRLAKQEIAKNPYNMSGLRKSIKAFNARMEKILGNDIYSGSAESVGNARLQAAKDVRSTLNGFLADNLESPPVGGRLPANTTMDGKAVGGQISAKTKVQGGGVYRTQLQKEAQLLNAKNEIAFRARGTLGKTRAQKFLKRHPIINRVVNVIPGATGISAGVGIIK